MNKYNFEIYLDVGDGYELVTNQESIKKVQSVSVTREQPLMFTRIKMGEITFKNVPDYKIYDIIDDLDFTTEIKIKIVYSDLTIEGYFAKIDCKFDDDKNGKTIVATPAINDQYRRFLENYETEIILTDNNWNYETANTRITSESLLKRDVWTKNSPNVQDYGKKELKDKQWDKVNTEGEIDFALFFNVGNSNEGEPNIDGAFEFPPYDASDKNSVSLGGLISQQDAITNYEGKSLGWELCDVTVWRGESWWVPFKTMREFFVTCKFALERKFVSTSDGTATGSQVYPPGGSDKGWNPYTESPVFETRNGGTFGYWFSRAPFNGAYADTWTLADVEENDGSGGGASFQWTHKRNSKINYPATDEDDGVIELNTLIDLKDMLTYMYQQLHEDLADKEVKSLFFWNDDEADFDFMQGLLGCNYVTAEVNELNNLKCFHTYDLKTEVDDSGEDEDSILSLTIKSMIEDLQRLFPLKWHIDEDLNLHLEHPKYYEMIKSTLDISEKKEVQMTKQFDFDTSDLFEEKTFGQINAGYVDFNNNTMTFDQIVSNNRNKDIAYEITTEIFTTDIRFCLENPNTLDNGLVLVLAKNGEVINDTGFVSENEQQNGALCLSQLLHKYWTYEGVWVEGQINGNDYNFNNTIRAKIGTELKFRGIDNSLFFTTPIGIGLMDEGTLDLENESTTVNLRYRYNSSNLGDSGYYLAWGDNEGDIFDIGNTEY